MTISEQYRKIIDETGTADELGTLRNLAADLVIAGAAALVANNADGSAKLRAGTVEELATVMESPALRSFASAWAMLAVIRNASRVSYNEHDEEGRSPYVENHRASLAAVLYTLANGSTDAARRFWISPEAEDPAQRFAADMGFSGI